MPSNGTNTHYNCPQYSLVVVKPVNPVSYHEIALFKLFSWKESAFHEIKSLVPQHSGGSVYLYDA